MANWVDQSVLRGTQPLKFALAVLPSGFLLHVWPDHKSAALGLGLALGVLCAQLAPPRQAVRWLLLRMAIFGVLGAVLPKLNW